MGAEASIPMDVSADDIDTQAERVGGRLHMQDGDPGAGSPPPPQLAPSLLAPEDPTGEDGVDEHWYTLEEWRRDRLKNRVDEWAAAADAVHTPGWARAPHVLLEAALSWLGPRALLRAELACRRWAVRVRHARGMWPAVAARGFLLEEWAPWQLGDAMWALHPLAQRMSDVPFLDLRERPTRGGRKGVFVPANLASRLVTENAGTLRGVALEGGDELYGCARASLPGFGSLLSELPLSRLDAGVVLRLRTRGHERQYARYVACLGPVRSLALEYLDADQALWDAVVRRRGAHALAALRICGPGGAMCGPAGAPVVMCGLGAWLCRLSIENVTAAAWPLAPALEHLEWLNVTLLSPGTADYPCLRTLRLALHDRGACTAAAALIRGAPALRALAVCWAGGADRAFAAEPEAAVIVEAQASAEHVFAEALRDHVPHIEALGWTGDVVPCITLAKVAARRASTAHTLVLGGSAGNALLDLLSAPSTLSRACRIYTNGAASVATRCATLQLRSHVLVPEGVDGYALHAGEDERPNGLPDEDCPDPAAAVGPWAHVWGPFGE